MLYVAHDAHETDPNEYVSGGHAYLERIIKAQQAGGMRLALVRFEDGVITHWHTHPGEQVLYVVTGKCRFGNEAGERLIAGVGDAIYIPAGERHWHGAVAGTHMAHLSITTIGDAHWMEPVEDPGI